MFFFILNSSNGCRIRGYCERFLHTPINCFYQLANKTKPPILHSMTLLTSDHQETYWPISENYASNLNGTNSPVIISKYSISIVVAIYDGETGINVIKPDQYFFSFEYVCIFQVVFRFFIFSFLIEIIDTQLSYDIK